MESPHIHSGKCSDYCRNMANQYYGALRRGRYLVLPMTARDAELAAYGYNLEDYDSTGLI